MKIGTRALLGLTFFLATVSRLSAQAPPASAPGERTEAHYWAVLLDASASFDQRDRAKSQVLGNPDYRLRNEVAALVETLLGAQRRKNNQRDDYLFLYVFGATVEPVNPLAVPKVRWPAAHDEPAYAQVISAAIRKAAFTQRTDYFAALGRAVKDFRALPLAAGIEPRFHVVLISDGELDVGAKNRLPGMKPQDEELEKYNYFLSFDVDPMKWLREHGVTLHTLAIDEGFQGIDDSARQAQIGARLERYLTFGPSYLEAAAALVRDLAQRSGPDGQLPESEGPYVLHAMASSFSGFSQARSVDYDNMPQVLWQTIFSDSTPNRTGIAEGATGIIVFAPYNSPVPIRRREGADLTLFWDREHGTRRVEPAGADADVVLDQVPSSQYVTWIIQAPDLEDVGGQAVSEGQQGIRFTTIQNVALHWIKPGPSDVAVLGEPLDLVLELRWRDAPASPDFARWREILRRIPLLATATVQGPDGTELPAPRGEITPVEDGSLTLLRLRLPVEEATKKGSYHAEVSLYLGDSATVAPLKAEPLTFVMVETTPLKQFDLVVRGWEDNEPGSAAAVERPEPDRAGEVAEVVASPDPAKVSFEWWAEEGGSCDGVAAIRLALPDLQRDLDQQDNTLATGTQEWEGDRLICFRTVPMAVPEPLLRRPLTAGVADGRIAWEGRWQVVPTMAAWKKTALKFLAALLALGLIAGWFFRGPLWSWLAEKRLALTAIGADFPLAVEWEGGTLAWRKGAGPRRFLLSVAAGGPLRCELSGRQPGKTEQSVEIRPRAKNFYAVRQVSGSAAMAREIPRGSEAGTWHPMGPDGLEISILELAERKHFELRLGEHTATVGHRDL